MNTRTSLEALSDKSDPTTVTRTIVDTLEVLHAHYEPCSSNENNLFKSLDLITSNLSLNQYFKEEHFVRLLQVMPKLQELLYATGMYRYIYEKIKLNKDSLLSNGTFMLIGPTNTANPPFSRLMNENPRIGSLYYGQYFTSSNSLFNPLVLDNLRDAMKFWHPHTMLYPQVLNSYMRSTYIDQQYDRVVKHRLNNLVQKQFKTDIKWQPVRHKIAIVSGRFRAGFPTFENRWPLFEKLKDSYQIDLIAIGGGADEFPVGLVDNLITFDFNENRVSLDPFITNKYGIIFYPDIGMNLMSRYLSNLRLAPIQVTTNSHPVSTWGGQIDAFISGEQAELEPSIAQTFYSERLMLIPGVGILPNLRNKLEEKPVRQSSNSNSLTISCTWGAFKGTSAGLELLADLQHLSPVQLHYRFFLSALTRPSAEYIKRDIERVLGETNVTVSFNLSPQSYLNLLCDCDLALDSFPFGGNTTVLDALQARVPILCIDGWQFYNKAGPAILRRAGLEDLVANNESDFKQIFISLARDPQRRLALRKKLEMLDFGRLLSELSSSSAYVDCFADLQATADK